MYDSRLLDPENKTTELGRTHSRIRELTAEINNHVAQTKLKSLERKALYAKSKQLQIEAMEAAGKVQKVKPKNTCKTIATITKQEIERRITNMPAEDRIKLINSLAASITKEATL